MVAIVAWPSYRQKESLSYRREESQVTLLDGEYDEDPFVEKQPGRQPRKVSLAIVAGLITFFFLDFVAYLYIARMLLFHRPSEDELEFRNPYIGLNELSSSEEARPSKYDRIVNLPRLAAHVSWVEPDLVMPFDVHRWLTDFGYVSPPDRQLQVSSAVCIFLTAVNRTFDDSTPGTQHIAIRCDGLWHGALQSRHPLTFPWRCASTSLLPQGRCGHRTP